MDCVALCAENRAHPVCAYSADRRSPSHNTHCRCAKPGAEPGKRLRVQVAAAPEPAKRPRGLCALCGRASCGSACLGNQAVNAAAAARAAQRAASAAHKRANPEDHKDAYGEEAEDCAAGDSAVEDEDAEDGEAEREEVPASVAVLALAEDHLHAHAYGHAGRAAGDTARFATDAQLALYVHFLADTDLYGGATPAALFERLRSDFEAAGRVVHTVFDRAVGLDLLPFAFHAPWRALRTSETAPLGKSADRLGLSAGAVHMMSPPRDAAEQAVRRQRRQVVMNRRFVGATLELHEVGVDRTGARTDVVRETLWADSMGRETCLGPRETAVLAAVDPGWAARYSASHFRAWSLALDSAQRKLLGEWRARCIPVEAADLGSLDHALAGYCSLAVARPTRSRAGAPGPACYLAVEEDEESSVSASQESSQDSQASYLDSAAGSQAASRASRASQASQASQASRASQASSQASSQDSANDDADSSRGSSASASEADGPAQCCICLADGLATDADALCSCARKLCAEHSASHALRWRAHVQTPLERRDAP